MRDQRKCWQKIKKGNGVSRARLLKIQRRRDSVWRWKANVLKTALESENSNFSVPALRQGWGKGAGGEWAAPSPRSAGGNAVPGRAPGFRASSTGKEHYVKRNRGSSRQSERGGRRAVGGEARRESTEQYGNKIMKTERLAFCSFWKPGMKVMGIITGWKVCIRT